MVLDEFQKWVGDDEGVMKDREKRIAFKKEYCNSKEWKFIWKVFNGEVSNCLKVLEISYMIILTERNKVRKIQK